MKKINVILFIGIILILTACSKPTGSDNSNDLNQPPTMGLPEQFNFISNETLTEDFSVYVNDEDNDALTLSVTGNTQIVIAITGLTVEMSAPDDWTGSETVTFIVDDGYIRSSVSDVAIVNVFEPGTSIITLESTTVNYGTDFDIALTTTMLDASINVISYQCTLRYDINYLVYNSASLDNTIVNSMFLTNEIEPGVIIIACAGFDPIIGEGAIAFFNFTALNVGETIIGVEDFHYNSDNMSILIDSIVIIE